MRGMLVSGFFSLFFNLYSFYMWPILSTAAAPSAVGPVSSNVISVLSSTSSMDMNGSSAYGMNGMHQWHWGYNHIEMCEIAAAAINVSTNSSTSAAASSTFNNMTIGIGALDTILPAQLSFFSSVAVAISQWLSTLSLFLPSLPSLATLKALPVLPSLDGLLYCWLLLLITLNTLQLPVRITLHLWCWDCSRAAEVFDASTAVREMTRSDIWVLNRLIGRIQVRLILSLTLILKILKILKFYILYMH